MSKRLKKAEKKILAMTLEALVQFVLLNGQDEAKAVPPAACEYCGKQLERSKADVHIDGYFCNDSCYDALSDPDVQQGLAENEVYNNGPRDVKGAPKGPRIERWIDGPSDYDTRFCDLGEDYWQIWRHGEHIYTRYPEQMCQADRKALEYGLAQEAEQLARAQDKMREATFASVGFSVADAEEESADVQLPLSEWRTITIVGTQVKRGKIATKYGVVYLSLHENGEPGGVFDGKPCVSFNFEYESWYYYVEQGLMCHQNMESSEHYARDFAAFCAIEESKGSKRWHGVKKR